MDKEAYEYCIALVILKLRQYRNDEITKEQLFEFIDEMDEGQYNRVIN